MRRVNKTAKPEADEAPKKRHRKALPADAMRGVRPVVAIVGRPNIGKSTLFNRLVRERIAIVEDVPGVTRDRHYADAELGGRDVVLVDTGGFDPESTDPMREGITRHVELALREADVVIALLDASEPLTPADRAAAELLRRGKARVVWVANKADDKQRAIDSMEHYELGMNELIPISALHGRGLPQLEDAIAAALPKGENAGAAYDESVPRVAIVGRPNAGKSSLTNKLLGEDRQLVDARPGTTVDPIDTLLERADGRRYVLIDTAGIRRKRGIEEAVESIAVMKAIRSIERADVVLLLVDASEGMAEQDARLAGLISERGRALVVGLNKADLLDEKGRKQAMQFAKETLAFAPWARIVSLSAKTGRSVNRLLDEIDAARAEHGKRVSTSEINRFFEEVLAHHPPPTAKGRPVRLYYVTQAETHPPRFVIVTNTPDDVHFSYQRYVVNAIRERFGFDGTPVRVTYKAKQRRSSGQPAERKSLTRPMR